MIRIIHVVIKPNPCHKNESLKSITFVADEMVVYHINRDKYNLTVIQ